MDLTLLLPTHNRSDLAARQLAYLSSSGLPPGVTIAVLDSSSLVHAETTRLAAARYGARYHDYPPDTGVIAKLAIGFTAARSSYAAVVADDDFLFLDALPEIIAVLDRDPGVAAAHGHYFEFTTSGDASELRPLYQGANLDGADSLGRVERLLHSYEPLTYAVYRCAAAAAIFAEAARQDSPLAQELLGSALAAAHGRVRRLALLSHGRRASSTLGYRGWHPLEWLARDPAALFEDYARYRGPLLAALSVQSPAMPEVELRRRIDLCHLAYLAEFLAPELLRRLARISIPASDDCNGAAQVIERAWEHYFAVMGPVWKRPLRGNNVLLRTGRRMWRASELSRRLRRLRSAGAVSIPVAVAGRRHTVSWSAELLDSIGIAPIKADMALRPISAALASLETGSDSPRPEVVGQSP